MTSVNEKTLTRYEWLRHIPGFLLQLDQVPLAGNAPLFPWEELSNGISKVLEIEGLKIESSDVRWRTHDEFSQGVLNPQLLHFGITGMEGSISWMLSKTDLVFLASLLIANESDPLENIDPSYIEGFHQFLALEALQALQQSSFDNSLNIQLLEEGQLPDDAALGIDIRITLPNRQILGRLLVSSPCRKSWAAHYLQQKDKVWTDEGFLDRIPVVVNLEAGSVALTNNEWKGINLGDFLILDSCSIDPTEGKSRVTMKVNGTTLFRGKIKEGAVKILELSTIEKVDKAMARTPDDEDQFSEFNEESEEEDLEFSELEDFEETNTDMESEEVSVQETTLPTAKSEAPKVPKEPAKPVSPMDIPLSISVEVGRLQMSVKKLMELQPGNMLELDIKPENSVDLIVNGKLVATGELLKVGETLGVRILEKQ